MIFSLSLYIYVWDISCTLIVINKKSHKVKADGDMYYGVSMYVSVRVYNNVCMGCISRVSHTTPNNTQKKSKNSFPAKRLPTFPYFLGQIFIYINIIKHYSQFSHFL